ncbi:hypothetical protein Q1695_007106 [Nippostrongylus brasiliensis]|nr:hypothetical protein Q1695_007106 [Nippostrongylus brasiliensis]
MWEQRLRLFAFCVLTTFSTGAKVRHVQLPAIPISQHLDVMEHSAMRIYQLNDFVNHTAFIRSSPIRCAETNVVIVSFLTLWIPPRLLTYDAILERAFIIKVRNYDYQLSTTHGASYFALNKTTISANLMQRNKSVSQYSENKVAAFRLTIHISPHIGEATAIYHSGIKEIRVNTTLEILDARYVAVFATDMEKCPTLITEISEHFPVWNKDEPISVKGIEVEKPQRITVLRDVIIACIVIGCYYYALNGVILPLYFHIFMPLPKHEESQRQTARETEEVFVSAPAPETDAPLPSESVATSGSVTSRSRPSVHTPGVLKKNAR